MKKIDLPNVSNLFIFINNLTMDPLITLIIIRISSLIIIINNQWCNDIHKHMPNLKLFLLSVCIIAPILEEVLFRYAFYHLLEAYINNHECINIINGIIFGVLHNIVAFSDKNYIRHVVVFMANGYLGYYLATIHNNLIICMIVHSLYNIIGMASLLYFNDAVKTINIEDDLKKQICIRTERRRRSKSLNIDADNIKNLYIYRFGSRDSLAENLLQSINNYENNLQLRQKKLIK